MTHEMSCSPELGSHCRISQVLLRNTAQSAPTWGGSMSAVLLIARQGVDNSPNLHPLPASAPVGGREPLKGTGAAHVPSPPVDAAVLRSGPAWAADDAGVSRRR